MKNRFNSFKQFEISKKSQRNIRGGQAWDCKYTIGNTNQLFTIRHDSDQAAIQNCNAASNCVGCEPVNNSLAGGPVSTINIE